MAPKSLNPMTQTVTRILLIEDSMDDAVLTRAYLRDSLPRGFDLTHVQRLADALEKIQASVFDAVLLDLNLPDSERLDTAAAVLEAGPKLPVLVLSGYDDEGTAIEAVRAGAQDYLLKDDLNARVLRRAMNHAIERKRAELELERLAMYDELTGLPNRALLSDRWTQARARARHGPCRTGLLVIDLDGLKQINERFGYQAGDHCLKVVAARLSGALGGRDTAARIGGDEFAILLDRIDGLEDAQLAADKIHRTLVEPIDLKGESLLLGATIGKAVARDGEEIEALISQADSEVYSAKCVRRSIDARASAPA